MNYFLGFLPHGVEWFWIVLIIVLLFGADKLPGLARSLGRSVGEFKKAKKEFDKEVDSALKDEKKPEEAKKDETKNPPAG